MQKSFYVLTTAHGATPGTTGGGCPCGAKMKLELQIEGEGLDFLKSYGFKEVDTLPGSCHLCGKPIAFRRLTVSGVEDLRSA